MTMLLPRQHSHPDLPLTGYICAYSEVIDRDEKVRLTADLLCLLLNVMGCLIV
jgi:hypothetical protein